ncbi:hypothetical protein [Micromonospora sp. NBC_01638]|uniref:hypothetical protein n=1 Tax=Micromonospora sp. NBC_01638 TaxID=2975982 RepID=UPI003868E9AE|nr:hypothetical protein OG811_25655 [Micromonospora sp. NBC_01638]
MTSELPAYAVPGIESEDPTGDPGYFFYRVDRLAGFPPVAAAIGRTPSVLPAICSDDSSMREAFAQSSAALCRQLWIGTADGLHWELSFGDGVKFIVDAGDEPVDFLRDALVAQPRVSSAEHYCDENFKVETTQVLRADEMAAYFIDTVVTAHREFARRQGIDLPY